MTGPFRLILLLGCVSLFSDVTYEGARSIAGPYLGLLGASALAVGFVAGLGELLGYGLRLLSGWLADKSRAYWTVATLGYLVNLLSVPALALVGSWPQAAVLMALERAGKAIRTPARDTILSFASSSTHRGLGFGIHEALDQIGAILGPLIVAWVLGVRGNYREAFAFLGVPAVLALLVLWGARKEYRDPLVLEKGPRVVGSKRFPKAFWFYVVAMGFMGAGLPDFAFIGYHLAERGVLTARLVPASYALAMAVDALCALVFGWLFDKKGIRIVVFLASSSSISLPLAFSGKRELILLGIALWGMGIGALDSVAKAVIAELLPPERRGLGYGVFHAAFGACWFGGSLLLGATYVHFSPKTAALCSFGLLVCSVPLFLRLKDLIPQPSGQSVSK